MQFFVLGAAVFFFAVSIALNAYSATLLSRSIEILRFVLVRLDNLNRNDETFRKEGTL